MSKKDNGMHTLAVGPRIAELLRARHPRNTDKLVARDIGCDPRTVKEWLAGRAPGTEHLLSLMARYGKEFALSVLEPVIGHCSAEEMDWRLEQLGEQIAQMREEIARNNGVDRKEASRSLVGRG